MREIALDTETTGLDPKAGHRIVEIGCVEMMDRIRTGKTFQVYINPERDMPEEACRVHGLTSHFLSDKPVFEDIANDFLAFIGDDRLVIHNAEFDLKFLDFELRQLKKPPISLARVTDTLLLARRKFPGAPASLDALCKRYTIDLSGREKHGALLDCELLADVYLELMGGRQASMLLAQESVNASGGQEGTIQKVRQPIPSRSFPSSDAELALHNAFITRIRNPLWMQ